MSESYYKDALKKASKEMRACLSRGEYPYLPKLDDFLPPERLLRGTDMGVTQIPMEFVAGTKSGGRTNAFARNFMPLLPETSEFAVKWKRLCDAHLETGIRDPVQAYEFMNRYYIEEGNKRVSVLKFFDAPSLSAHVVRIPPAEHSAETDLYRELMDFYKLSGTNFLEFSKPGSCQSLQRLLGKMPGDAWTDDERNAFSTAYYYFRKAYLSNGGGRLSITVGDAMLAYIRVYGYQDLRNRDETRMKKSVAKVWEEITLQQENPAIEVSMTPERKKTGNLLSKALPKPMLKAAFIHDKNPSRSVWVSAHEIGRGYVERVLEGDVETAAYFDAIENDPAETIEKAIREGYTVLFTTSPRLLQASLRAAVDHPGVTVLNCSLNTSHRYIRTYYARMYEISYITGAIAGALAGSDPVGYICDYPIYGQVAGINAFALGVGITNPRAVVHLDWSSVGDLHSAAERLTAKGIRLICSRSPECPPCTYAPSNPPCTDAPSNPPEHPADPGAFTLSLLSDAGQVTLATAFYRWGIYYEAILRRIRDRSFQAEYAGSGKALNYYWGLAQGVVELCCSEKLPDSSRRLAKLLEESICSGTYHPFYGPAYAQDGRLMVRDKEPFTTGQIIGMDWLNENIIGNIPAYKELNDTGRATAEIVGVPPASDETA